jgi:hypothetical protein
MEAEAGSGGGGGVVWRRRRHLEFAAAASGDCGGLLTSFPLFFFNELQITVL